METNIFTERLQLRLLQVEDINDIYAYASDPLVAQNTAWPAHQQIEDSIAFVQYVLSKQSIHPAQLRLVWGILEIGTEKVIGTISFKQDDLEEGHVDYALARQFWGLGYVSEAVKNLIEWIFKTLPELQRIRSGCLSRNIGSVRVLEKNGFQLVKKYVSQRDGKFGGQELETSLFVKHR